MEQGYVHEARREDRRTVRQEVSEAISPEGRAAAQRAVRRGRRAPSEHAVFLIPGFLGFERFSTFPYFADRVVAALRAGLECASNEPVPVIPVPIPPTAPLRERQRQMIKTLCDRLHALEHDYGSRTVHLVGHSTGGVDATLLTEEAPIGGGDWADIDPRAPALRRRIRSVVTIASPHQGACFTRDPVARFLAARDLTGLPPLVKLLASFGLASMHDVELGDFLFSVKREATKSARFLWRLLPRWALIDDLDPSRSPPKSRRLPGVVRRTFVTLAGTPRLDTCSIPPADHFFRELSLRAGGWLTGSAEEGQHVKASLARLQEALTGPRWDDLVIKSDAVELPAELGADTNDGVVNTARQLIDPDDRDELAGIVVGDHFDVVGYYDRYVFSLGKDGHEQASHVLSGFLHSGSGFRDTEFFELYRRVAKVIVQSYATAPAGAWAGVSR